jgi:MFS family permease
MDFPGGRNVTTTDLKAASSTTMPATAYAGTTAGTVAPAGSDLYLPVHRARRVGVVLALSLALTAAALDVSVVATVTPAVRGELADGNLTPWLVTAYLLATIVATPILGKLGDLFGRRGILQFSLIVVAAGAALASLSQSVVELIVFRSLVGVGAAGIVVSALAMVAEFVPARRRARYVGWFAVVVSLSFVVGPPVAAAVAGYASWRWCLLGEAAIAVPVLLLVALTVKPSRPPHGSTPTLARAHAPTTPPEERQPVVDVLGSLLFACLATGFVLLVSWTGSRYAWNSPVVLGLAAGTLVTAVLFVAVERRAVEPLVPLSLLRRRAIVLAGLICILAGGTAFAGLGELPGALRLVKNATASEAGLLMFPVAAGVVGGALLASSMMAGTGRYKVLPVLGTLIAAPSLGGLALLSPDTPPWQGALAMAGLGVGAGLLVPVLVVAVQNALPTRVTGVGTALVIGTVQVGAVVGTVGFGAFDAARLARGQGPSVFAYGVPVLAVAVVLAILLTEVPLQRHLAGEASRRRGQGDEPRMTISLPGQPTDRGRFATDQGRVRDPVEAGRSTDDSPAGTSDEVGGDDQATDDETGGSIQVRVIQADGRTIPGVVLTLCDMAGREITRSVALGDGMYELTAPDLSAYLVIASAQAYLPHAQVIGVRDPRTFVEITLSGESGAYGTVCSAAGEPVNGATVTLANPLGEVVASAATGMDGSYALIDLLPGAYTMAVNALGYRPDAHAVRVPEQGRIRRDIELVGGGHLYGTIRGTTGNPLRDARVTLVDSWGRVARVTASGPSGHYRFAELAEGEYTLVATMYPPAASGVRVTGGQHHQHDIELTYPEL